MKHLPKTFFPVAAWATVVVTAVLAASAVPAAAAPAKCSKRPSELFRDAQQQLYPRNGALLRCTKARKAERLGPWGRRGGQLSVSGDTVFWTVRAKGADRVWAYRAGRAWLRGIKPSGGPAASLDERILSLRATWRLGAWVTEGGQVVQAFDRSSRLGPEDDPDYYYGAGPRPAAAGGLDDATDPFTLPESQPPVDAAPAGVPAQVAAVAPQGLLRPEGTARRQVIGRWSTYAGPRLAGSLTLDVQWGESDGCGGSGALLVGVEPVPGRLIGWRTDLGFQRCSNLDALSLQTPTRTPAPPPGPGRGARAWPADERRGS